MMQSAITRMDLNPTPLPAPVESPHQADDTMQFDPKNDPRIMIGVDFDDDFDLSSASESDSPETERREQFIKKLLDEMHATRNTPVETKLEWDGNSDKLIWKKIIVVNSRDTAEAMQEWKDAKSAGKSSGVFQPKPVERCVICYQNVDADMQSQMEHINTCRNSSVYHQDRYKLLLYSDKELKQLVTLPHKRFQPWYRVTPKMRRFRKQKKSKRKKPKKSVTYGNVYELNKDEYDMRNLVMRYYYGYKNNFGKHQVKPSAEYSYNRSKPHEGLAKFHDRFSKREEKPSKRILKKPEDDEPTRRLCSVHESSNAFAGTMTGIMGVMIFAAFIFKRLLASKKQTVIPQYE